ncbi:MAG: TldD/PmbA family protein [Thermoproteota archaeon]|nr:TldD/PmbA family protein [Candidatus Brockarchaeota archaeon]
MVDIEHECALSLDWATKSGCKFADLRFHRVTYFSGNKRESKQGVYARVYYDGSWGFFYYDRIQRKREGLIRTIRSAMKIAKTKPLAQKFEIPSELRATTDEVEKGLNCNTETVKEILNYIQGLVQNTGVLHHDVRKCQLKENLIIIQNSIGTSIRTRWRFIKIDLSLIHNKHLDIRQDFSITFSSIKEAKRYLTDAIRDISETMNLLSYSRKRAYRNEKPKWLIFSPTTAGTIFHEVCGHGSEADFPASSTFFPMKKGTEISSKEISVFDDPLLSNLLTSYDYDDEGVPAKRKVLVDHGVFVKQLSNIMTAGSMNIELTGNGRAQDHRSFPFVRMSNIIISPGKWTMEKIIEESKSAIYVNQLYGNISKTFSSVCRGSYFVNSHGEVERIANSIILHGDTFDILKNIDAVENKIYLQSVDCIKGKQRLEVGIGCGHIRLPTANIVVKGM